VYRPIAVYENAYQFNLFRFILVSFISIALNAP